MKVSRTPQLSDVSHCCVVADGVRAEWIEAHVARSGQWTLVHFHCGLSTRSVGTNRQWLGDLARATGARVFSVGCRFDPECPQPASTEDGLAAYGWLLNEGVDLDTTAFVATVDCGRLALAVLLAAGECGLPLPTAGVLHFPYLLGRAPAHAAIS
jgi:acetyl esterase/lipase